MNNSYAFPCPNCGSYALRRHFVSQEAIYHSCPKQQVIATECPICDYVMTICSLDGKVIATSSSQFTVTAQDKSVMKPQIISFKGKISA